MTTFTLGELQVHEDRSNEIARFIFDKTKAFALATGTFKSFDDMSVDSWELHKNAIGVYLEEEWWNGEADMHFISLPIAALTDEGFQPAVDAIVRERAEREAEKASAQADAARAERLRQYRTLREEFGDEA